MEFEKDLGCTEEEARAIKLTLLEKLKGVDQEYFWRLWDEYIMTKGLLDMYKNELQKTKKEMI